ncbi:hypothetical protein ScPMuIL_000349 [Solemya velum]
MIAPDVPDSDSEERLRSKTRRRATMNYSRFLNRIALARRPNPIRVLAGILQQGPPTMISMAGGNPNSYNFPLTEATLTLRDGSKLTVDPDSLKQALQYSATPGITDLFDWVKGLQKRVHKPPTLLNSTSDGHLDFLITNGSQDGICKALEAMTSVDDNVLMEIPCYVGTLSIVRPRGLNILPVNVDHNGVDPNHLKKQLSRWKPSDAKDPESKIPKIFYTIPNGSNPTGCGQTEDRKRAIYELAQEYDLMILEDDPYFYVQFQRPYVPSYLSMDVDGRVIRFDSFSKLISSGIRLGFVSGPEPIINKLALHMQTSVMHASGLSQVVLLKVLQKMGSTASRNMQLKWLSFMRRSVTNVWRQPENI